MDALYTMIIAACIGGEPTCRQEVRTSGYASLSACESEIDAATRAMSRRFGTEPGLKGRQVTYDVTCMDRQQTTAYLAQAPQDL